MFKISIIQTLVPFRHDDDKKHKIYLCNLMLSIERWQTCYIRSDQNCLHSVQSLVQPLVCRHEQSSVGLLDCGGEKRVQVLVRWRHGLQVWPLIFFIYLLSLLFISRKKEICKVFVDLLSRPRRATVRTGP